MKIPANRPTSTQLLELATRFRAAIEKCNRSCLPENCKEFPQGSCGDTSTLLGTFLADAGMGRFRYVYGERTKNGKWGTHAWIEGAGYIIDITADQFPEVNEPVLVLPKSASAWHGTFKQERREIADYRLHDPHSQNELGCAYQCIKNAMIDKEATLVLVGN